MDGVKENLSEIKGNVKKYIETNIDYFQLWGFKITTRALSLLLKVFLLSLFLLLSLILLSFALAFAIGEHFQSYTLGFASVGVIYILVSLILYFFGRAFIDSTVIRKFSDIFFKD